MAAQFSVSKFVPLHYQVLTAVQDGWMAIRVQHRMVSEACDLLSEPYLSEFKRDSELYDTLSHWPRLYLSYNAATRKTTALTNDVNGLHLRMVDRLRGYATKPGQPEEFAFQLLFEWCSAILEYFKEVAERWDDKVSTPVCAIHASTLDGVADLFATAERVENSCGGIRP
jgi:hypothetical protein